MTKKVIGRLLFTLAFLGSTLAALGQSVVFEQEAKRFASAEGPTFKPVLSLLSPAAKVSYQYQASVKVIAGSSPGIFALSLYVEPEAISGTRRMDGYDVSARLWPDSLSVMYALLDPAGASVVGQMLTASAASLREGIRQNLQTKVDWSRVRLSVKILKVLFSPLQVQDLQAAKAQIARYSFVTGNLAALPGEVKRFEKIEDPDTLDARLQELNLLEAAIPDVRSYASAKPFWLSEQDARTTESLAQENTQLIAELRARLQKQASGIRELVAAKANKLFRTAKRGRALPYYQRLLALDPGNDQAVDRVTLLSVEAGQTESAVRTLIENAGLMQGFSHQRTVDKAGRALEVTVLKKTRGNNPDEAKAEIFLMDSLCKKFPGYRCPNLAYTKPAAPVRDAYAKLMNRARVETSLDKLDVALATIEEALASAQEGNLPVANQQSALSLQQQVADRYINKLCFQAQNAYRKSQDSTATEQLATATVISDKYHRKLPEMYRKLLTTHAEPYVLTQAKRSGDEPAQINARRTAGRYIAIFRLDADKKVAAVTNNVAKQVQSNDCRRTQTEVNELVAKGLKAEKELSFVLAQTQYGKALDASRKKTECLINNTFLLEKLSSVEKPAYYQSLINRAEEHLDESRYDSAFASYALAEKLYEEQNLAQRFLIGVSVPATVRVPKYAGFALFAGERYMRLGQLDSALTMAQIATRGKANKTDLQTFTTQLAYRLADRDRKAGPRAEPRQLVLQYSRGDKKLKEFEKAYLKAWDINP